MPAYVVGHMDLPTPFAPNRQSYQREVARLLERARLKPDAPTAPIAPRSSDGQDGDHPVLHDPKLEDRLRAATQADRVDREVKEIEERIGSRVGSLARRFDRVRADTRSVGLSRRLGADSRG